MPHKDPEKRRAYQRNYQKKWRNKHSVKWAAILKKWYLANRDEKLKKTVIGNRKRRHLIRQFTLEKYGGIPPKCACCGEQIYEFLTIDHIKGGGRKHRESLKSSTYGLFGWLHRSKYRPDKYQVLCFNCNCAKYYQGICPHQAKKF